MAIIVNTNMSALGIQQNLASAGDAMQVAMKRMATGSKINSAADDSAGMAVAANLTTTINGSKVAQTNVQLGSNLLSTSEGTLNTMKSNIQRIRDLTEQAANGTYDSKSKTAIKSEIDARVLEITRLGTSTEFNGIKLFSTSTTGAQALSLQVGSGAASDNTIALDASLFASVTASSLGVTAASITTAFATTGTAANFTTLLANCDTALDAITTKKTSIGAYQNRLASASETLKVSSLNLSAARSTIQDADIAVESANYVQNQILQQASASLLAQANQAPSIAINLI